MNDPSMWIFSHYILQLIEDETIDLHYVPTIDQTAEILTKLLGPNKFVKLRGQLRVMDRLTIKRGGYYDNK